MVSELEKQNRERGGGGGWCEMTKTGEMGKMGKKYWEEGERESWQEREKVCFGNRDDQVSAKAPQNGPSLYKELTRIEKMSLSTPLKVNKAFLLFFKKSIEVQQNTL